MSSFGSGAPVLDRKRARALAMEAGFHEAGLVALPHSSEERNAERFAAWVGAGNARSMTYLERTDGEGRLVRSRARIPFPWASSALVCWAGYNSPRPREQDGSLATPGRAKTTPRAARAPATITRFCSGA